MKYPLSKEGIRLNGHFFSQNVMQKSKGLDLKVELPLIKLC